MAKTNTAAIKETRPYCPHCGEPNMAKAGGNPSGTKVCQKYKCRKCRRTWTDVNQPFEPAILNKKYDAARALLTKIRSNPTNRL